MKGEMPYTTRGNVIGVVVGSKVEGFEENPRTFFEGDYFGKDWLDKFEVL